MEIMIRDEHSVKTFKDVESLLDFLEWSGLIDEYWLVEDEDDKRE